MTAVEPFDSDILLSRLGLDTKFYSASMPDFAQYLLTHQNEDYGLEPSVLVAVMLSKRKLMLYLASGAIFPIHGRADMLARVRRAITVMSHRLPDDCVTKSWDFLLDLWCLDWNARPIDWQKDFKLEINLLNRKTLEHCKQNIVSLVCSMQFVRLDSLLLYELLLLVCEPQMPCLPFGLAYHIVDKARSTLVLHESKINSHV